MQSVSGLEPSSRKCSGYHHVEDADDVSDSVMGDAAEYDAFATHHANSDKRGIDEARSSSQPHIDDTNDTSEPLKKKTIPPNGKKTKGRVKIKMEFIDNKLRRYTTFSKRKTGIMKKAYELSTLTGTQVMLLVASETGHVYTFATRKLQPMITSESGKALIQTCLNSPDPPVGPGSSGDQRMSATGFEETELTYSVGDDQNSENKQRGDLSPRMVLPNCPPSTSPDSASSSGSSSPVNISQSGIPTVPVVSLTLPSSTSTSVNATSSIPISSLSFLSQPGTITTASISNTTAVNGGNKSPNSAATISMQLPQTAAGFTTILTPTATLSPGTPLHIGALQAAQGQTSSQHSNSQSQSQPVYRIPQAPLVTIPAGSSQQSTNAGGGNPQGPNTVTVVPTTQQSLSVVSGNVMIPAHPSIPPTSTSVPGTVMYQTPQGVVYAASSSTLPEGVILNLGQTHTLSLQHEHGNGTQQYITIPVPVSLTAAQQQSLMASLNQNSSGRVEGNANMAASSSSSADSLLIKKERKSNCISRNT